MVRLRLLLLPIVAPLQACSQCQGLLSLSQQRHRLISNIHRLRGGDDNDPTDVVDRPKAPEDPIAFVDISLEAPAQQQPSDHDNNINTSNQAAQASTCSASASTSSSTQQSDSLATGGGIRSMAKDALKSMTVSPVETLKKIKDRVSVDALRAKTSAISARALIVQTLFLFGSKSRPLTPLSVLSISLLGSALGFHSYLWFATVGYTVAVGLVSLVALIVYNVLPASNRPMPFLANLHTLLVLTWSIRLTAFLLYREYVAWPSLHAKTKEVDQESHEESKLGVWVTAGCFYAAMVAPCCYRLQAGMDDRDGSGKWGLVGKFGILMQFLGLIFEGVGDAQKATFKASEGNRKNWCNVGLWNWFSHPNYLGEIIFWLGTYIGGIGSYTATYQYLISTIGLIFIAAVMKSATDSLSAQELRRYGMNEEYLEFRRVRGFLGPFKLTRQPEHQILL